MLVWSKRQNDLLAPAISLTQDSSNSYGGASPLIAPSTNIGVAQAFTVGLVSGVPPTAPANLTAAPGNTLATLSWVASAGAAGYNVEYSLTSGGPYTVVATNIAGPVLHIPD